MNILQTFRYLNKGLTILLTTLFAATVISAIYLSHTLLELRSLLREGTSAASAALVLQDLEFNIETAESTTRGYVITGRSTYLTTYASAVAVIPNEQKALENPAYGIGSTQLKSLNNLIAQRHNRLDQIIALRKTKGFTPAAAAVADNTGIATVADVRDRITSIVTKRLQPFGGNYQRMLNRLHLALIISGIVVGFVFILCLLILRYFRRAIQKERAIEGSKSEFLSLASHQLRTPATNVKQYVGLLLEGYLGELTTEQINALKVADKNNEMEISIINDLLDVAKLDLNKISLHKESVNVYTLAKEVVDAFQPQLRERKQTAKFNHPDKKATALADVTYLKSIIENLLDNASKYSSAKSRIFIGIEAHPRKVSLSVRDEGVGMKKKEMAKLFKKFSRIPNTLSENVEGTGLGLYWVKQVVELHGGRVTVKSEYGKGSTFAVELPIS